jgi:hypothetical protein
MHLILTSSRVIVSHFPVKPYWSQSHCATLGTYVERTLHLCRVGPVYVVSSYDNLEVSIRPVNSDRGFKVFEQVTKQSRFPFLC